MLFNMCNGGIEISLDQSEGYLGWEDTVHEKQLIF